MSLRVYKRFLGLACYISVLESPLRFASSYNMKLTVVVSLVALAMAAPGPQIFRPQGGRPTTILRDERVDQGNGNFRYAYELSDGTAVQAEGTPGQDGAVIMRGSYRYVLPDGNVAEITYVADENGFHPRGNVIPTPPPLPPHAIQQIRYAEEERARGVVYE
ncbi:cuticle protein AMP1A-like [Macrobrachium rosenbergii]|uniref:cuticle protein AMP1A-like n=1 Tax=Macrobrachium rosenbergii TaxID=79674 RepID=UPI0034D6D0A1